MLKVFDFLVNNGKSLLKSYCLFWYVAFDCLHKTLPLSFLLLKQFFVVAEDNEQRYVVFSDKLKYVEPFTIQFSSMLVNQNALLRNYLVINLTYNSN